MPLGAQLRSRLLGQGPGEAHAQATPLVGLEIGRQSHSLITDRNPSYLASAAREANPNLTARAIRICMLCGIGDQLGHDECEANGSVRREEERLRPFKGDIAVWRYFLQIVTNVG